MKSLVFLVLLCLEYISEGAVIDVGAANIEVDASYLKGTEYSDVSWLMKNPIGVSGTLKGYRYQGKMNGGSEIHLQVWRPVDWFVAADDYYILLIDTPTTPPSSMTKINTVQLWRQDEIEVRSTDYLGLACRGKFGVAYSFADNGTALMSRRMANVGEYAQFEDLPYPYEFLVEAEVEVHATN